MELKDYTDEEIIEEIKRRNITVHIDYIELRVFMNNKKIKAFGVESE